MPLLRLFVLTMVTAATTSLSAQEFTLVRLFDIPDRVRGKTVPRVANDGVFMDAMGPNGYEVFGTDGFRISSSNINPVGDADPWNFIPYDDHLYFTARSSDVDPQFEWYRTDGLSIVPVSEADYDPTVSTSPGKPFVHDGKLLFHGNGPNGRELLSYDGETLDEVDDLWIGPGSAFPNPGSDLGRVEEVHGKAVFSALTPEGQRLFALDGSTITQLSDRPVDLGYGTVVGDHLYFPGYEITAGASTSDNFLYRTDGTTLERVVEIGQDLPVRGTPRYLTAVGDSLYFVAAGPPESDVHNQPYLFRLRGDELTPMDFEGIHAFNPRRLLSNDGRLILQGSIDGDRLVFTTTQNDPLTAVQLPNGLSGSGPFGVHDGWFYFQRGTNLFRTDGNGTGEVVGELTGDLGVESAFDSTPDGLFLQPPGAALHWSDGHSVLEIGPAGGGGVYFEGAFYYLAEPPGEDVMAVFKVVPADSQARADFNRNGVVDAGDLDILAQRTRSPDPDLVEAAFDVDQNERLDLEDRRVWVHDFAKTYFGDSNLDGSFTSSDLVSVFVAGEYEDSIPGNSTWATGDWNGDGDFTTSDFVLAFQDGGYELEATDFVSVPEPSTLLLALIPLAAASFSRWRSFLPSSSRLVSTSSSRLRGSSTRNDDLALIRGTGEIRGFSFETATAPRQPPVRRSCAVVP
jgi:hypothetical protein